MKPKEKRERVIKPRIVVSISRGVAAQIAMHDIDLVLNRPIKADVALDSILDIVDRWAAADHRDELTDAERKA